MDQRVLQIKNRFSQDLGRSWSVAEMSDEVNMSITAFHALFRKITGSSPMAYLNDLRLEKARDMLGDPTCFLQIKQIRVEVGIANDSHFTQDFKARFGMTPTEYRQHQAEIHQSLSPDGQE